MNLFAIFCRFEIFYIVLVYYFNSRAPHVQVQPNQDGSASYLTFRHGTLHGPSYEVRPSTSAEDVGSVDLSFWHVRVAVETVGLYLEGQPAGRWWRRRSDGLEVVAKRHNAIDEFKGKGIISTLFFL